MFDCQKFFSNSYLDHGITTIEGAASFVRGRGRAFQTIYLCTGFCEYFSWSSDEAQLPPHPVANRSFFPYSRLLEIFVLRWLDQIGDRKRILRWIGSESELLSSNWNRTELEPLPASADKLKSNFFIRIPSSGWRLNKKKLVEFPLQKETYLLFGITQMHRTEKSFFSDFFKAQKSVFGRLKSTPSVSKRTACTSKVTVRIACESSVCF